MMRKLLAALFFTVGSASIALAVFCGTAASQQPPNTLQVVVTASTAAKASEAPSFTRKEPYLWCLHVAWLCSLLA